MDFKIGDKVKISPLVARRLGIDSKKEYVIETIIGSDFGEQVILVGQEFPGTIHNGYVFKPATKTNYKVGDKVRIIDNNAGHNLEIGSIQTITRIFEDGSGVGFIKWAARFEDIEPVIATTEPYRTVMKRELKPGRYGRVRISDTLQVRVEAVNTVEQLDEVIHTINQIREVLEDA